jgi:hypothetical protein
MLLAGLFGGVIARGLLWQYSQAQVFFVRSVFVYGILLAAWGLACLSRRQLLMVAPAALLGAAAIYIGRASTPGVPADCESNRCLDKVFAVPMLVTLALAIVVVVAVGVFHRSTRRTWLAIAVTTAIGLTVAPTLRGLQYYDFPIQSTYNSIAPGGIPAARWIRANSGTDDLIATNIHCHAPTGKRCHTGSYWIPGYAERRVLVEGWSLTPQANSGGTAALALYGKFWDQEKLRVNDQAFYAPTREGLETLRTQYGVRWLFADKRVRKISPELDQLAELRFESRSVRVYELIPG